MGNYKLRLSDMIPNAWFYKLKYMTRPRNNLNNKTLINPTNNNQITSTSSSTAAPSNNIPPSTLLTSQSQSSCSDQRKSYYFTRDLTNLHPNNSPTTKTTKISVSDKIEPPRKSSRRRRSTKRMIISRRHPPSHQLVSSSLSAGCSCRATLESVVWTKPPEEESTIDIEQTSSSEHGSLLTEYGSDRGLTPDTTFDGMLSLAANSCKCRTHENDVVLEEENERISDHLRPIITKKVQEPTKIRQRTSAELSERSAFGSLSVKLVKEDFLTSTTNNTVSPVRRSSSSPGVKLRTNSPRIANRRIQGRKSLPSPNSSSGSRRSVTAAETFAVVKSSKDPRRDFRESMVEMIVENNLRASKDLEELLACYLSLNSDEYHDVIINVFKQIWFDFVHLRLN
ncbi:hypothetical protein ACP275_10G006000 [Erythranthe tilingii]